MPIKVGDKLPSVDLFEGTPNDKVNISTMTDKKVVIFGLPGAYTPGCSKTHLPGYVENADAIKQKGVSDIFCVACNDMFVMDAWGKEHNATGKVRMLSDPRAEFAKALDVELDLTGVLGSMRNKRYSMVVDNGVVTQMNLEPDGNGLNVSLAPKLLEQL